MKPWSEFYDLVRPAVPGCPVVAVNSELRQSAIAFCEQTLAWKYTHPDITVTIDTAEYPFEPESGAVVHVITHAEFNDKEIETNTAESDMWIQDWRHQTGLPKYVLGGPLALTLVPTPDVEGTVKLIVVLKPSPTAEGVDDDIFNEYREAIVDGTLGRLMLSSKKPYTNIDLGTYHMQQFFSKAAAAGTRAARNYTRSPLRTSIMRRR